MKLDHLLRQAKNIVLGGLAVPLLLATGGVADAMTAYTVALDGSQEVGGGDPTGSGTATLTLDSAAGTINWTLVANNLFNPFPSIYPISLSGWHIHGPGGTAGSNAGVLVNLGDVSGVVLTGTGTALSGSSSGTVNVSSTIIDSILANPSGHYLNLHTTDGFGGAFAGFPGGAIRGQVPEPGTFVLMTLGLAGLAYQSRKRQA